MGEDIRTTRTKRKIKKAFLELLKERTYEHITVSDISSLAGVNRVTFYTHYIDKACLLADIMDDHKKNYINAVAQNLTTLKTEDEFVKYCLSLATALLDSALMAKDYILILNNKENGIMLKMFVEQTSCLVEENLKYINSKSPLKYPTNHVASFIVPAYVNLVANYISEKNPIPVEQFRKNIEEITTNLIKYNIFFK